MTSPKQIQANRENAQKSPGPRTEAGKARSSQNAITHGLTAEQVIIDGEDAVAFEQLVKGLLEEYTEQHGALGALQEELIILMAGVLWRLRRVIMCEAAIITARCAEFDEKSDTDKAPVRSHLAEMAERLRIPPPGEEEYRLSRGEPPKPDAAPSSEETSNKADETSPEAEPDPEKEERDKVHSLMLCLGRSLIRNGSDNDALLHLARYERELVSRLERLLKLLDAPWGGFSRKSGHISTINAEAQEVQE